MSCHVSLPLSLCSLLSHPMVQTVAPVMLRSQPATVSQQGEPTGLPPSCKCVCLGTVTSVCTLPHTVPFNATPHPHDHRYVPSTISHPPLSSPPLLSPPFPSCPPLQTCHPHSRPTIQCEVQDGSRKHALQLLPRNHAVDEVGGGRVW